MLVPTKLLSYKSGLPIPVAYWDDGTGTPLDGLAYRWRLTLTVSPQNHSSESTRAAYVYNALDVKVGDWICDGSGNVLKIVSLSNQTSSSVRVIVEDVDRFNTINDTSMSGDGSPVSPQGVIFSLTEQGYPQVSGITAGTVRPDIYSEILSRFQFRNEVSSYISFQSAEDFNVGDVIMVTSSGFEKASSRPGRVIGTISEKGVPGRGWYSYTPYGKYRNNLPFELDGNLGDIWYFDATAPHQVSKVRPVSGPVIPVYLRLTNSREVMEFDMFNDLDTVSGVVKIDPTQITLNKANVSILPTISISSVFVNGLKVEGWSLAAGVITFDPALVGYNIDNTDVLTYTIVVKAI